MRPGNGAPIYEIDETQTAFLADRFLEWLDGRSAEPWCAHVSFVSPHPPFIVPPPFNTMFRPEDGSPFRRAGSPAEEVRQHPLLGYWRELSVAGNYLAGGGDVVGHRAELLVGLRAQRHAWYTNLRAYARGAGAGR